MTLPDSYIFNQVYDPTTKSIKTTGGSGGGSNPTSIIPKTYTIGTAITQLNTQSATYILIKIDENNTDTVYITDSTGSDAYPLTKGNEYVLDVTNTNIIYMKADADGQTIYTVTGGI